MASMSVVFAIVAAIGADGMGPTSDTPVIEIQNMGCERRCPVFRLSLFANGNTYYEGTAYVAVARRISYRLPPTRIEAWRQALAAQTSDRVGCPVYRVDAGRAVIHFIDGGRARTIVDNRGCDEPRAGAVRRILAEIYAIAALRRLIGDGTVRGSAVR